MADDAGTSTSAGDAPRRGSPVAAWMLIDSPLGWVSRGDVAELLAQADDRAVAAERTAALATYEAALAEHRYERLANRRTVRLATELASSARPARLRTAPTRLRDAAAPRSVGGPPQLPQLPEPRPRPSRSAEELTERGLLPPRPTRPTAFGHLRVLHLGASARFGGLAPHTPLDPATWRDQLAAGADLLVVEPPAGEPEWDPLEGELAAALAAAAELGVPSVRIAPGPTAVAGPGGAHLELTEAPAGRGPGDTVLPSIETALFNPYGWRSDPPDPVVAVLATAPDAAGRRLLEGFEPPVTLVRPPDLEAGADVRFVRRVATPAGLRRSLIRAGVLLDHPAWRGDPSTALRRWAAALACGTPVVAVDVASVTDTPPPGVLDVAEGDLVEAVHGLLVDRDLRERHGIVGRRWALRAASRETQLRTILEHLTIPAPAPERTTVLLSTHRPVLLDHALDSVARQRRDGVDVSLVLHGEAFDGVDAPQRDGLLSAVTRAPGAWTLGDCLNAALDGASGELVAKMDDDDHYGDEHLGDLIDAWHYSGADVVGKAVEFVHLAGRNVTLRRPTSSPERDRRHVGGPTPLASREVLRRHRFLRLPRRVDSTLYERVLDDGGRVYGIHSRDFVLERHEDGHAWDVAEAAFLDTAVEVRDGFDLGFASSEPDGD